MAYPRPVSPLAPSEYRAFIEQLQAFEAIDEVEDGIQRHRKAMREEQTE